MFGPKRVPANNNDFGDLKTLMMHLKRRNIKFLELRDGDFGIFLGEHKGKWIVGILAEGFSKRLISGESFDSLEELKQTWELD